MLKEAFKILPMTVWMAFVLLIGCGSPMNAQGATASLKVSGIEAPNIAHRVDTISSLRAIVGGPGRLLVQAQGYTLASDGAVTWWRWDASSTATDDGLFVVKPTAISSGSPGRWRRSLIGPLNVLTAGLKADNVTNDWPAYQSAATANAGGDILLPSGRTVYFSPGRPRLQDYDVRLIADPSAALRMDATPGMKDVKLASPVKVIKPSGAVHVYPQNQNRDVTLAWTGAAANEAARMAPTFTSSNFTTDWTVNHITGRYTVTANAATVTATSIAWPTGFGSAEQEGVYKVPAASSEYGEVSFVHAGPAVGSGYISVEIVGDIYRYSVGFFEGSGTAQIIRHDGQIVRTITLPNSLAYTISGSGSITLAARVFDRRTVEVYSNDRLVTTFDITSNGGNTAVAYYGFATSWHLAQKMTLQDPFFASNTAPQSARKMQISILGDSISYGAFASLDYGAHLAQILSQTPGFGDVTIRNRAVSSSTTTSWVNGGSYTGDGVTTNYSLATEDFTADSYVLVMLGTNDCQGSASLATFETNLGTIADKIVADGATPIFGIPPVFANGAGSNYGNIAKYGAVVRRFCLARGYQVAEVRSAIGSATDWYIDGIHPTEKGAVAIAKAFAAALRRAGSPRSSGDISLTAVTTYANGWTGYASAGYRDASYERIGKRAYFSGMMKSGTVGAGVLAFTLPPAMRPAKARFFSVPSWSSTSGYKMAVIIVKETGLVEVWDGYNTWVSLDGIQFDL